MNSLHIVSTPTADTDGLGLMLHFDHRRYHFGSLGGGTQRSYVQRGYSLTKVEKMFVSGPVSWGRIGGLLGMMLTVADALASAKKEQELQKQLRQASGKKAPPATVEKTLEIFGGGNLTFSVATARDFVFRQGLPIKTTDFDSDPRLGSSDYDYSMPDWEDDSIQVWQVPISPPRAPEDGTTSPRKRTFDMMAVSGEPGGTLASQNQEQDDQQQRQQADKEAWRNVIESMFNSDWTPDTLVESRLGDVQLPAKLFVRKNGQIRKYYGPMPDKNPQAADYKVLHRLPWPAVLTTDLPKTSPCPTSISYVVKNRGRRGKFNPKAAKELGVAVTDYKKVAAGETVKGKDDTEVTPDMVLGESIKGRGFAVLEIPSRSYLQPLLDRPEWKSDELVNNVLVFFWVLGKGLFDDPSLQQFIRDRPSIKHIIVAPDVSPNMLTFESYALLFTKLHRIDPDRFPVLKFDNTTGDLTSAGPSVLVGRTGMSAQLLPHFQFKDDGIVPFPTLEEAKNVSQEVLDLAREAKQKISQPQFREEVERDERDMPNRDAEIVPLGTGSTLPSKYRSVSATLIRVPGIGDYLLDCGENTLGQIRRSYGLAEAERIMAGLKGIFISHMHADHHLGLASVLCHWFRATVASDPSARLTICGPKPLQHWLNEYSQVEDLGMSRVNFVLCDDVTPAAAAASSASPSLAGSGLRGIVSVPVEHCVNAFAGVLSWPSGLKVAYSGDCRPSNAFAAAGKGATLLVHECTFEDDKRDDAIAKKHSTMSEALGIGEKMGARRVLLTHFSQRYAKIQPVEGRTVVQAEGDEGDGAAGGEADGRKPGAETEHNAKSQVVLFSFDQMRVKMGEFRYAEAFLPAVRKFFEFENE